MPPGMEAAGLTAKNLCVKTWDLVGDLGSATHLTAKEIRLNTMIAKEKTVDWRALLTMAKRKPNKQKNKKKLTQQLTTPKTTLNNSNVNFKNTMVVKRSVLNKGTKKLIV